MPLGGREAARRPGGRPTRGAGLGSLGPGGHWLVQGLCHSEEWQTGPERGPAPEVIRGKPRPAQWAAYQVQTVAGLSKSAPLGCVRSQVPARLPAKCPGGVPCCLSPGLQCVRCPRRQVASPRGSEPRPGPAWRSTAHPCRSWGARHPSSLFPERLPVPGTVLGAETQPGLALQESTFPVIPGPVLGTRTLPQASPKAFLPLEPPGHCRGGAGARGVASGGIWGFRASTCTQPGDRTRGSPCSPRFPAAVTWPLGGSRRHRPGPLEGRVGPHGPLFPLPK